MEERRMNKNKNEILIQVMILFSVKIRKYCLESGLVRHYFLQHFGAKNRFAKPARAEASLL